MKSLPRYELSGREQEAVAALIADLMSRPRPGDPASFLAALRLSAQELPRSLRGFVNDVRFGDAPAGVSVVSGYPINDDRLGPTPDHWSNRAATARSFAEDLWLLMLGSLVGDAFGWATQQAGNLVHEVMPVKGHEHEQLGSSSEEPLTWHTEDAFHPYRADFLGLMCLRNPTGIGTLVACVDDLQLSPEVTEVLAGARYTIRPDESHLPKNAGGTPPRETRATLEASYARIDSMRRNPDNIAVLSGDPGRLWIRIDPYFMTPPAHDPSAAAALRAIVQQIDQRLFEVPHRVGDVLFLDNRRVVHGRRSFRAQYDGRDRWLKRILITRDLPASRASRAHARSPVML